MTAAFDKIMAGVKDAAAHVEGNEDAVKLHAFEAVDVKAIRKKTGLSQAKFANMFHILVGTLRNWEQGRRRPEGPAMALLHIIDKEPEAVLRALSD